MKVKGKQRQENGALLPIGADGPPELLGVPVGGVSGDPGEPPNVVPGS